MVGTIPAVVVNEIYSPPRAPREKERLNLSLDSNGEKKTTKNLRSRGFGGISISGEMCICASLSLSVLVCHAGTLLNYSIVVEAFCGKKEATQTERKWKHCLPKVVHWL